MMEEEIIEEVELEEEEEEEEDEEEEGDDNPSPVRAPKQSPEKVRSPNRPVPASILMSNPDPKRRSYDVKFLHAPFGLKFRGVR